MGILLKRALTPTGVGAEDEHLDAESIARFVEGRVEGEEKNAFMHHLNRCEECYEVLSETLRDVSDQEAAQGKKASRSFRPLYALAASIVVAVLIGGTYLFDHYRGTMVTAEVVLDGWLRSILMEDSAVRWKDPERISRLAGLLRSRGVEIKQLTGVELKTPYFPTKSLFGPKEVVKIRIEKGIACLEVIREKEE